MTRENKIALVVGFGLVLIVGILISDHFSEARTRQPAELTQAIDPLSSAPSTDPDLIAVRTAPVERNRPTAASAVPPRTTIEMGTQIGLSPQQAQTLPWTFHDVRLGESLTSISIAYYGDATLISELSEYNGMENPNDLTAGRRIRIPSASELVRQPTVVDPTAFTAAAPARVTPPTPAAKKPAKPRRYTVKDGDNLSGIAKRLLGSHQAYTKIFEHNRDILSSPDELREGMVLTIPVANAES